MNMHRLGNNCLRKWNNVVLYLILLAAELSNALSHCSEVTWAPWRLKSPVTRLFVQQLVQTSIKENSKASLKVYNLISQHGNTPPFFILIIFSWRWKIFPHYTIVFRRTLDFFLGLKFQFCTHFCFYGLFIDSFVKRLRAPFQNK